MNPPSVAIIVVNYRGRADTLECLESLRRLTYPSFSVLLVDQDSGDGTPDAVRERFPEVDVVESLENDGFSGANNRAAKRALEKGADYLFLLNNDTVVAPDLLDVLVGGAESVPEIGIAGPVMLYFDAPDTVWSMGGAMSWRGESRMIGQGRAASEVGFDSPLVDVEFIVGCGLLVKRAVWEAAGGMDGRFFLYYEEADLCAWVRRAGWRCVTVPGARLQHKVSRTTGTDSALTLYYMRRNVLLFLEKNASRPNFARLAASADTLRLALVWALRGDRRCRTLLYALSDYYRGCLGKSQHP